MEHTLVQTEAVIMKCDTRTSQWVQAGSGGGFSNIMVLKSTDDQYRYVAINETTNEAILNSFITVDTQYQETTDIFHCLCEPSNIYGLQFKNPADAKRFASTIYCSLDHLQECKSRANPRPPKQEPPMVQPVVQPEGDKRRPRGGGGGGIFGRQSSFNKPSSNTTHNQVPLTVNTNNRDKPPPSAPSTKPAPSGGAPPAPPPPGPPPPGPPPPTAVPIVKSQPKPAASGGGGGGGGSDFASQLKAAAEKPRTVDISEKTSNLEGGGGSGGGGSNNNASSGGGGGGGGDFLSEMMSKFKQRQSGSTPKPVDVPKGSNSGSPIPTVQKNNETLYGTARRASTGVRPSINQMGSSSTDSSKNISNQDLEKLRNDIMNDFSVKIEKMKTEIIQAICEKLNV